MDSSIVPFLSKWSNHNLTCYGFPPATPNRAFPQSDTSEAEMDLLQLYLCLINFLFLLFFSPLLYPPVFPFALFCWDLSYLSHSGVSKVSKPNSSSHISVPHVILTSLLCTSSSLDEAPLNMGNHRQGQRAEKVRMQTLKTTLASCLHENPNRRGTFSSHLNSCWS